MTDEQTAAEIGRMCNIDKHEVEEVEAAIVRALQAARKECMDADDVDLVAPTPEVVATLRTKAPTGHIIDDAGVVRKVLGTLPITKDGCVVGDDCRVWQDGQMWNTELFRVPTGSNGRWAPYRTNKVYSSEAAEAAKEGADATHS